MFSKNILVTGGAGYIGSHACKSLTQAGYLPIVYDNLVYGHEWAVKWGPLEIGDITDRNRLVEVFEKYQPSAVMHFAAYAYVGESVEKPLKYYRNNVSGTLTLLEVMRDHDVKKIVFSSSCATYGIPLQVPIKEDHPQSPVSPYGRSKLMVEKMLKDCDAAYGLRSINLRYFNAAGADLDGEIGECHDPETHLIPLVLDVASGKRSQIEMFGNDYATPDGTCIRDYIHVTDLAKAHVLALNKLEDGYHSDVFNLGNGTGFSVRQIINTASDVTGKEIKVLIGSRRPGDPPELVGDATKARKSLGWQPEFVELKTIIGSAWNFAKRSSI